MSVCEGDCVWCAFGRVCGRVGSAVCEGVRELGMGACGDMSNSGSNV